MMITLQIEIDKGKIKNFDELVAMTRGAVLEAGREIVAQTLESWDNEIEGSRDRKRYRNKGKRKTCVKTWLGPIEYERNVYVDQADPANKRCVYLLDEEKEIAEMILIVEGVVMCFVLLIICVIGIANGPVGLVVFYEQEADHCETDRKGGTKGRYPGII